MKKLLSAIFTCSLILSNMSAATLEDKKLELEKVKIQLTQAKDKKEYLKYKNEYDVLKNEIYDLEENQTQAKSLEDLAKEFDRKSNQTELGKLKW
jgi:cell division protein FtsB